MKNCIEGLKSSGLYPAIYISYDGTGLHECLRGVKGAEAMSERAIKLCLDNSFYVAADMCFHKHNQHTISESVRRMVSLGVSVIRIGGISNNGSWKENNEADNALSTEGLFNLYYEYLPQFFEDDIYIPGYMEKPKLDNCLCYARTTEMYISPEGRILPYMPIAGTILNDRMPLIQEKTLAECINSSEWFNIVNIRVRDFYAANKECRKCEHISVCESGCLADTLEAELDNYMAESPAVCALIKGGLPQKIIDLMRAIKPDVKCANLTRK